ncbi:hypothetical protein [Actinomadura geliboluensis]|uniref:hypothetical protein n=1 Tax=Actinomadura geliboluensis TaxID=882440 RepID=UPI00261E2A14|nr:hypothetical protein [Actinomadura geliboluensis]
MDGTRPRPKVDILPAGGGSLAHGLPPAAPGTLFARGPSGGMRVAPEARFSLIFGRGEPDVHVCVGGHDPYVSRQAGYIRHDGSHWVLHNIGRLAIRFPDRLVLGGHHAALPPSYTPLIIVAPNQEHLLEVSIAPRTRWEAEDRHEVGTSDPDGWPLTPVEHLVLVCLSRRYLAQEPAPQPLTWVQVADELGRLRPDERWTAKRAAHIVAEVRKRLNPHVPGLRESELSPPLGNQLNHNLITELLVSATIVQSDLAFLE